MVKKFKIHKKAFLYPDREKQDIPMSHKTRIRHFLRLSYKTCKWVLVLATFFILFALGFWIYNWLRFRGKNA